MTAEQAEVVGQDVTVERLTQLSAERTATDPAGETAEDSARYGTEGDADRSGECAECCTSLTTCQSSADAARNTTDSTDGSAGFHGVMERSDFGGVTARALQ